MLVAMVMVMDRQRLIGKAGGLPWHLPSELAYFKSVTMGKPLIMGRSTFESIGRPLPGRPSIVMTRNADWLAEWSADATHRSLLDNASHPVLVANNLDQALTLAQAHLGQQPHDPPECAVIGGAAVCRDAMPRTGKLYLTRLHQTFDGDTWLDSFDESDWTVESSRDATADDVSLSYEVLLRKHKI